MQKRDTKTSSFSYNVAGKSAVAFSGQADHELGGKVAKRPMTRLPREREAIQTVESAK